MIYLAIFLGRIIDVSIGAVRTNLMVRGYKALAAILAFVEVSVWLIVSSNVLTDIAKDPLKAIVYSLGFATGFYVGGMIEEKLAIGMSKIHIVVEDKYVSYLIDKLKSANFGVAPVEIGHDVNRHILLVFTKRKRTNECVKLVKEIQEDAVVVISDVRSVMGGFIKSKLD